MQKDPNSSRSRHRDAVADDVRSDEDERQKDGRYRRRTGRTKNPRTLPSVFRPPTVDGPPLRGTEIFPRRAVTSRSPRTGRASAMRRLIPGYPTRKLRQTAMRIRMISIPLHPALT